MYKGLPDKNEIVTLLSQLSDIKTDYGKAEKVTVEEMNQIFTGNQITELVEEITANIPIALELITQSETCRYVNKDRPE